jgi:tRNA nucleotidyltransferase (CCA-adding enzyme)
VPARFRIHEPVLASTLRQIDQMVRRAGGRTWLVGGSVRDLVWGRQPRDLDVEIVGISPGHLHALLSEQFSVEFVGKAFGVFKLHGLPVDISIPSRVIGHTDSISGLLRQTDPFMEIDDALARRDFTMNAMAWDPDTRELRDPFHGQADVEARVLRHVSEQFSEDPLRVLRGMQLAARFELVGAPATTALCRTLTQDGQPRERLWEEWKKLILDGVTPSYGLRFLSDCGWLRFYPELASLKGCPQDPVWHPEGDVWVHTLHCLDWFANERTGETEDDLIVGLGVLCHDFGKPATTREELDHVTSRGHEPAGEAPARRFLERLTNQADLIEQVISLVLCHLRPRALYDAQASDAAVRRLAKQVTRIDRLVRVARADHAGRPPRPFDGFPAGEWLLKKARSLEVERQVPTPIIMGRHLIELGVSPGPFMGAVLEDCYEAQLDGVFTDLPGGLAYARLKLASHS